MLNTEAAIKTLLHSPAKSTVR